MNLYRPGDTGDRYVNAYPPGYGYGLPAPGLFGIALAEALAGYSDNNEDRFVNYGGDSLVIGDNVAACEARYRSYDPSTGMYLGYDGNYHPCRL
ncbi:BA14K family protein [Devosia insulae]|uniref:BA14K family protein n=1 Tax=Devosia insulae TaxID=408174 RepID=UPI001FCD76E4|nr:BA14K family protein [Devosia insulae]